MSELDLSKPELQQIRADLSEYIKYDDNPDAEKCARVLRLLDAGEINQMEMNYVVAVHHDVHVSVLAYLYATNDLAGSRREQFEAHLATCAACKDEVMWTHRVRDLARSLRNQPVGPCPTTRSLARYVAGLVKTKDRQDRIGRHILQCTNCMANYFGLHRSYQQIVH